jgi:pyruvate dehydrogenase E2 component (dihydrolipoamide acetyltransferase)
MSQEVKVPDIGNYSNVPVIEILVAPGDTVKKDQGLLTLESDKATMEVPAPFAGVVKEIRVKLGDEVSEGAVVAVIDAAEGAAQPAAAKAQAPAAKKEEPAAPAAAEAPKPAAAAAPPPVVAESTKPGIDAEIAGPRTPPVPFDASVVMPDKVPHASPAVRLFARELGVNLSAVSGSGRKARITREDVQNYVKQALAGGAAPRPAAAAPAAGGGLNLLPWPQVDFSKFGETETRALSRIKKISGANLARNWVMIPHVTQHDDADITELEALRVLVNKENEKAGLKLTMLAFLIKAVVAALKKFPDFNASLDASGENLVLKKYFHIGFAADTPNGLVVPVLRDADKKGVLDIARETGELAAKARDGKLGPADMSGGCFSISSLGGIGGTAFTPIVNAPEVAILGVSKSATKPVWDGKAFQPRLILPLSLSYDHRVIDGASAARFTSYLGQVLADMRRTLL